MLGLVSIIKVEEKFTLQLTILGNGPACPNTGGASSGYLVIAGDTSLVLDFGTGVVSSPEFRKALPDLTGIIISHLHTDHWIDLIPLGYLLKIGPNRQAQHPLKIWVPPGTRPQILKFLDDLTMGFPCNMYEVDEYSSDLPLRFPDFQVTFRQVEHYIACFAMRVENELASLTYSADSSLCQSLITIANGCDLFLCEAADGMNTPGIAQRGHMTAGEAGRAAASANVRKLLLTHVWEDYEAAAILQLAQTEFAGVCELAQRGQTYQICRTP